MKIIQKYLCLLALTLILVCAVVYSTPEAAEPLPCFAVQSPEGSRTQTISIFDAGDGNHYVFLPAYAEPEQVTVSLPKRILLHWKRSLWPTGWTAVFLNWKNPMR